MWERLFLHGLWPMRKVGKCFGRLPLRTLATAPVPDNVKEKQLKLIHTPKNRKKIYTKTVRYSDLDINGHMNNTKYADVLVDALSVDELKDRFISEMQLNYSDGMLCRGIHGDIPGNGR